MPVPYFSAPLQVPPQQSVSAAHVSLFTRHSLDGRIGIEIEGDAEPPGSAQLANQSSARTRMSPTLEAVAVAVAPRHLIGQG
jgi:hypothetical protein